MRLFYEAMQQNRNFGRGCEVPDKENAWRTNQFHVPDCRQGTAKKILRGLCGWIQTCVTRKRPAVSQGPHKDVRTQRAHEPGGERKRGLLRKRRNSSVGTLRFFQRKIGASDTKLAPTWSEWRDSNSRPLGPEPSALPNCATPRKIKQPNYYITQDAKKSRYRAAKLRTFADFASPAAFSLASASGLWYAEARQRLRRGVVLWIACTAQD